jgi:phage terminase small subunit
VTGDVVHPSIPDWLDIAGAQAIWSRFARQLALNISIYQPGCARLHCP